MAPITGLARRAVKRLLLALLPGGGEVSNLPPERWGLEVDGQGHLTFQGHDLTSLGRRWGSPLHVVMADRLRRNAADYLAVPADLAAGAEIYASYKTNPVPGVLRLLHGQGVGAEVISEYELWLALRLGVPPERIIYNGPAKSPRSIRTAIDRDILLLTLNHREELPAFEAAARAAGRRPSIGVRVTTSGGWGNQFGSRIDTGEALETFRAVHQGGALRVRGLHSHLGHVIRTRAQAEQHVGQVLAFTDVLRERLGLELDILDFGGSLGVPTTRPISRFEQWASGSLQRPMAAPDPAATIGIRDYVSTVAGAVQAHYRAAGRPAPRVALEPGRSMTGDTQLLLLTVLSVKAMAAGRPYVVLDAGINLAETAHWEYHQLFAASRMKAPLARVVALAGPICSPADVLRWAVAMPELEAGDNLVLMDSGAYFIPFQTDFSFPRPAVVLLDAGRERLLRRAESFEDMVQLDDPEGAAAAP